jgi:pimeloyl-ACP methyl ester carboxylesterase
LATGDPAYAELQARLAQQPDIGVPSITFDGTDDGVMPVGGTADQGHHFIGPHEHRVVQGAGHNLPQENPQAFVDAVRDLVRGNIGR